MNEPERKRKMIERDYIMRILQEFFDAMAKLVRFQAEDPDPSCLQERFDRVYGQFFRRPAAWFYETEKELILEALEAEGRSERDTLGKAQMLAELLYRDGLAKTAVPEKCMLLEKSLFLFEYRERNSRTFSWEQNVKMMDIKKVLTEYEMH
ncbi:MAG: hypothetical protein LBK22_10845 [Tannerella sp.]|jgi:hypothetical protein|nr:hypothetical protein [Tannerella sp.]